LFEHLQGILVSPPPPQNKSWDESGTLEKFNPAQNANHISLAQNPNLEPEQSVQELDEQPAPVIQQKTPIDAFLDSISTTPHPLLTQRPQQNPINQDTNHPIKRQSSRLAQKATVNSGKGPIEVAQDLLVKKLGALAGPNNTMANEPSLPDGLDFYAQHFAQPMDKTMMGAIQDLIEQGGMVQMENIHKAAAAAPRRVA
jgi:hypothetical protein